MAQQASSTPGPLVLMGGEHLTPASRPLWADLMALHAHHGGRLAVVPAALADAAAPKREYRLGLALEGLAGAGFAAEVIPILSPDQAGQPDLIGQIESWPGGFYLAGGAPRALLETLRYCPAWDALWRRHAGGALLIAAPGAAVGLGQHAFAPIEPGGQNAYPPQFEYLTGMDCLAEVGVVPHFDRLSPTLIDALLAVMPRDALLAGIDEGAALLIERVGCRVLGRGAVTIRDRAGVRQQVRAGQGIIAFESLFA
ncbi:MAG: hypothetical protein Kow00124_23260 [Anaerolineae bacterium]